MPKRGKRERNFSLHFCNYGMGCESKLENNRIEIEVKHKKVCYRKENVNSKTTHGFQHIFGKLV